MAAAQAIYRSTNSVEALLEDFVVAPIRCARPRPLCVDKNGKGGLLPPLPSARVWVARSAVRCNPYLIFFPCASAGGWIANASATVGATSMASTLCNVRLRKSGPAA